METRADHFLVLLHAGGHLRDSAIDGRAFGKVG
jgi:hypothetical protein